MCVCVLDHRCVGYHSADLSVPLGAQDFCSLAWPLSQFGGAIQLRSGYIAIAIGAPYPKLRSEFPVLTLPLSDQTCSASLLDRSSFFQFRPAFEPTRRIAKPMMKVTSAPTCRPGTRGELGTHLGTIGTTSTLEEEPLWFVSFSGGPP